MIYNKHHGNAPADAIYIGRGSAWGNPFVIGEHGSRDEVCDAFEKQLWDRLHSGELKLETMASLHGKDLVCFCAPARCHGQSLEKAAAWAHEQLLKTQPLPEFKLIVAGGRDYANSTELAAEIQRLADNELKGYAVSIVSGLAKGADRLAWSFAKTQGIKVYEFPTDWDAHGKSAGFIRNVEMGTFADGLLAFWDGQSKGTAHMIETMRNLGKSVRVIRYSNPLKQPLAVKRGLFKPVE